MRSLQLGRLSAFVFGIVTLFPLLASAKPIDARKILDSIDDLYRGESSHGIMSMTIKTAYWKRTIRIESWSQGKNKSLMRILAPKKEKGTTTLRVDKNVWNFLPKINRVIKVPSSMMSGSWMGSHITNDDLVKESRMADDFHFQITAQNTAPGKDRAATAEITCLPKPGAAVVWGKIVIDVKTLDKTTQWIPVRSTYFDEDLKVARVLTYSDVKRLGKRRQPSTMRMVPATKKQEFTEIRFESYEFDVKIPKTFFSLRRLRR